MLVTRAFACRAMSHRRGERVERQHVIAGFDQHIERDEQRLLCAGGDDDLRLGVGLDAGLDRQPLRDGLTQGIEAGPRGVVGLAVVQGTSRAARIWGAVVNPRDSPARSMVSSEVVCANGWRS